MPTPKPDTSPKNVARVLRSSSGRLMLWITNDRCRDILEERAIRAQVDAMESLADALEREAESAPTWEERVERAAATLEKRGIIAHWGKDAEERNKRHFRDMADSALRLAFPELAPSDD